MLLAIYMHTKFYTYTKQDSKYQITSWNYYKFVKIYLAIKMIIQLPNGRIIECSVEQYLSLSDEEIKDLNGLSAAYTKEVGNPFYNTYFDSNQIDLDEDDDYFHEKELALDEIDEIDKREDPDFQRDDV